MNEDKCIWFKGNLIAQLTPIQGDIGNEYDCFALWIGKLLIIWDWHGYRSPYLDVKSPIDMGYGD